MARAGDSGDINGQTDMEREEALLMDGDIIPSQPAANYRRKAAHAHRMAEGAMTQAVKASLFDKALRNGRLAAEADCAGKLRVPSRDKPIDRQTYKDQRPRWPRIVVMCTEKRWYRLVRRTLFLVIAVLGWLALASNVSKALTIIPSFDSSITTASNAVDIENSILSVVGTFDSLIADPINVKVFLLSELRRRTCSVKVTPPCMQFHTTLIPSCWPAKRH